MEILRKYGVQTDIYFPLIKRAVIDFAVSADYTYAAGDIKISKDGGAAANSTNSPSAITMGNTAIWKLTLTATEMQAAKIVLTLADSATKVVEDQAILIVTYGNASAEHEFDLDNAAPNVTVTAMSAGVITASVIATDAIGAAELAADAVSEIAAAVAAPTAAAIADAVWDEGQGGHTSTATFGQILQPLGAATATAGSASTITLAVGSSAVDDWYNGLIIFITSGTGSLQARRITDYVGSTRVATVQPNWNTNPASGSVYTIMPSGADLLATDAVQSIWDRATSALTTSGSIGKLLVDNINVALSTIAGYIDTEVAAIKSKTDNLPASPAATSDIPSAATNAAAVWDRLTSALTTANSIGKLLVDNINATISSRLASASYTAPDNSSITAIKAKTDNLPSDPADASDVAASFSTVNATLATIAGYIDTEVGAIKAKTDNLPTDPADESSIQAAIAALNNISVADLLGATIEGSYDLTEVLRILLAAVAGKSTGGGTTSVAFRDTSDSKDRIAATVDSNGNRTAITLDAS